MSDPTVCSADEMAMMKEGITTTTTTVAPDEEDGGTSFDDVRKIIQVFRYDFLCFPHMPTLCGTKVDTKRRLIQNSFHCFHFGLKRL